MSIQDDTEYQDDDGQAEQDNLRELREAAKSGKAAKAEADSLKRELAFSKAGIDTESAKGKMFVRAYDGDLDTAQIKAQFEELFGGGDGAPQGEPGVSDEERAAEQEALRTQTQERRDITSAGSDHAPPPEPDLISAGYKAFEDAIEQGRPRETAFKEILSGHIAAANAGQKNAVWTGWSDEDMDGWR